MQPVVYIQAGEDGSPYSVNGAVAARGFAVLGYEVRFFRSSEMADLPLTRDTVVVGGMGTLHTAMEQIGVHPPLHATVPAVLYPFLGRECWRTTIREVQEADRFPLFLKPYEASKLFTGRIFDNAEALKPLLAPREGYPTVSPDLPVLAQEPITFLSEWRAFVIRRTVVHISHYTGDPLLFPAAGVIRTTLGAYQNAPVGYSADFGISGDGRTLLVEVNDGYSLGHGGLVSNLYAELLLSRWREMTSL